MANSASAKAACSIVAARLPVLAPQPILLPRDPAPSVPEPEPEPEPQTQ